MGVWSRTTLISGRSNQDIINQAHVELADRRLFDLDNGRRNLEYGPLDKRMGVSGKNETCETCGESLQACNGHFGHVRLVLPVFHVGYFKKVISILQSICKACTIIESILKHTDHFRIALASSFPNSIVGSS